MPRDTILLSLTFGKALVLFTIVYFVMSLSLLMVKRKFERKQCSTSMKSERPNNVLYTIISCVSVIIILLLSMLVLANKWSLSMLHYKLLICTMCVLLSFTLFVRMSRTRHTFVDTSILYLLTMLLIIDLVLWPEKYAITDPSIALWLMFSKGYWNPSWRVHHPYYTSVFYVTVFESYVICKTIAINNAELQICWTLLCLFELICTILALRLLYGKAKLYNAIAFFLATILLLTSPPADTFSHVQKYMSATLVLYYAYIISTLIMQVHTTRISTNAKTRLSRLFPSYFLAVLVAISAIFSHGFGTVATILLSVLLLLISRNIDFRIFIVSVTITLAALVYVVYPQGVLRSIVEPFTSLLSINTAISYVKGRLVGWQSLYDRITPPIQALSWSTIPAIAMSWLLMCLLEGRSASKEVPYNIVYVTIVGFLLLLGGYWGYLTRTMGYGTMYPAYLLLGPATMYYFEQLLDSNSSGIRTIIIAIVSLLLIMHVTIACSDPMLNAKLLYKKNPVCCPNTDEDIILAKFFVHFVEWSNYRYLLVYAPLHIKFFSYIHGIRLPESYASTKELRDTVIPNITKGIIPKDTLIIIEGIKEIDKVLSRAQVNLYLSTTTTYRVFSTTP